jgi:dihydroorotase
MPVLAHVFEQDGALDRLEAFTSLNGPAFYGLPPNDGTITLSKAAGDLPGQIDTQDGPVTVFDPGFTPNWHVSARSSC